MSFTTASTHGFVREIRFAHPPHNHVTVEVLDAIADALDAADADDGVRAIILASEGRVFCAGADLAKSDGLGGDSEADPLWQFYEAALRIFASKKPIVAAVQGAAVGAGLGLAVAADFRVAAEDAKFAGNFTRLGFHPGFGLSVTLPRLIGHQRAAEMLLTSARFRADRVIDWGLVDRIAAPGDLLAAAYELAADIAANAPLATEQTRATLRAGLAEAVRAQLVHEHAVQTRLRATEDYAEGVASVFERREADFKRR